MRGGYVVFVLGVESLLFVRLEFVLVVDDGVVDELQVGKLEGVLLVPHSLGDVSVVLEEVYGLVQIVKVLVDRVLSLLASFLDVLFEVLLILR